MEPYPNIIASPDSYTTKPSKGSTIELIDSLEITQPILEGVLLPYLKRVYESIIVRAQTTHKGIPLYAFAEFLSLPGLISERLFSLFDRDEDLFLSTSEFIHGTSTLFGNSFDTNIKLIFDLFDFDADEIVTKEDIRTLLSHVPMSQVLHEMKLQPPREGQYTQMGGGLELYLDRMQCQEELVKIIDESFPGTELITLKMFKEVTEHVSSTIYLCMFLLLRRNSPIYSHFASYLSENQSLLKAKGIKIPFATPQYEKKLLSSPVISTLQKSKLSPIAALLKMAPCKKDIKGTASAKPKSILQRAIMGKAEPKKQHLSEEKKDQEKPLQIQSKEHVKWIDSHISGATSSPLINMNVVRVQTIESFPSAQKVSLFEEAKAIVQDKEKTLVLCACGCPCDAISDTTYKKQCSICIAKDKPTMHTGYLYEKEKDKTVLKRYWYKIIGQFLYKYEEKKSEEIVGMHSLIGSFIRDEFEEILENKSVLYPFSLFLGETKFKFYALKKEEKTKWVDRLKNILCYSSLSDFYEIQGVLGQGKFGLVRAGRNKVKGTNVAIKIIKKESLSQGEIGMIKREIEILKFCQHPNIIFLYDIFENTEYIYIVMELLRGGDLYSYLEKQKARLAEARVRHIVHSLATALFYLHSYGIIHRDIKLDNILLVDESEDSDVKLVDFGLSKLVGPNTKCDEPFGTYGYAAPEILKALPYDKGVDIWSLGIVAYELLSGERPFDGREEQDIAKKTLEKELSFLSGNWKNISKEAIDCVSRMLSKDASRRIKLKDLLLHPWILKDNLLTSKLRREAKKEKEFQMFTLINPGSMKIYDEINKRLEEDAATPSKK